MCWRTALIDYFYPYTRYNNLSATIEYDGIFIRTYCPLGQVHILRNNSEYKCTIFTKEKIEFAASTCIELIERLDEILK